MRWHFTLPALFLITTNPFAQEALLELKWPSEFDSIVMSIEHNITHEMTYEGQSEIHEEIGRVGLDQKESKQILKKFSRASSYQLGQSLLDHQNLFFTIFENGVICVDIAISTLTRNCAIEGLTKEPIHKKISLSFGNHLLRLITRHGYYDTMHEMGDMEGIE